MAQEKRSRIATPYNGTEHCWYCNSIAKYIFKNGKFMCSPHISKCSEYKRQREEKFMKKYGVKCLMSDPRFQDKIKQTNIEKYGYATPFESINIRQKAIATLLNNYGVDNPFKDESIKQRIQKTNIEKYGTKNVSSNINIKNKKIDSLLINYGVTNPQKSQVIRERTKQTNIEKYGYPHPMQNNTIARKSFTSAMCSKQFILPSGKTVSLMGYEQYALDDLLFSGISEYDIDFELSDFPKFSYIGENEKIAFYTPDFFIPRLNWVIEVKSTYTFILEKFKNLAKFRALKAAGYSANFLIITPKHPKLRVLREYSLQT